MKQNIRLFLAAATLIAAMSTTSSCSPETVPELQGPTGSSYLKVLCEDFLNDVGLAGGAVSDKGGTFSLSLYTNLPSGSVLVSSPDWIRSSVDGIHVSLQFGTNDTHDDRTGEITVFSKDGDVEPFSISVRQYGILTNAEGMVQFKDRNFKKAMLEVSDSDHDGEISPEEALAVETIDISNRGVKDLAGLDAFKNVWKFDALNNDIEDATIVHTLSRLHWLCLKGNKRLKTFDVRGCSSYFEVCDFEVTDELNYYLYYRQMGVTWPDDKNCLHSHHCIDTRVTTDWSREGEIYQVKQHTVGPGKVAVVFSGIGWIDVDVNDGTFERIIHEAIGLLKKVPGWDENWEYLDIYVMIHMAEKHGQWMVWNEDLVEELETGFEKPENKAKREAYNDHRKTLYKKMEKSVPNKYCFKITIDHHANMMINGTAIYMGDIIDFVPIPGYDSQKECKYGYFRLAQIFPSGNDPTGYHFDNFHNGQIQWDDWKDFD